MALSDLKGIYDYISKDSTKYAKLEVIKIKSRTRILRIRPLIGKEVIERGEVAIRELRQGNYRIIYKLIDAKRIDILTIHHSARDLGRTEID